MKPLKYVSRIALAGGLAAGALVMVTATSASAHFTCADGSTTTVDDPAVACEGHGGIAPGPATTEAPDHDHGAPATTAKKTTPTTKKSTSAVKAAPAFTG